MFPSNVLHASKAAMSDKITLKGNILYVSLLHIIIVVCAAVCDVWNIWNLSRGTLSDNGGFYV